jgi:hypothetical protein
VHRVIDITVPSDRSDQLIAALDTIEDVVGLTLHRSASVKPRGDVVTVHALNRATDQVMSAAASALQAFPYTIVTAEVASISDPEHQKRIDADVDEAVWEELETGLRHQGRLTANFLLLMALGGIIGAAGAFTEPAIAAVAYVASAIIAPGFEPLAKLPLGVVLKRGEVIRAGALATIVGYAVLAAAAGATWLVLSRVAGVEASAFLDGDVLKHTIHPSPELLTIALAGAFAGVLIQASYRRSVIAGALVAMRLIEAASVAGISLAMGRLDLAAASGTRLAVDAGFVLAAGVLVFGLKQLMVHRRAPLH